MEEERDLHPQRPVPQGFLRRQREQDRRFAEKLPWWRSSRIGYIICPILIGITTIVDLAMLQGRLNLYTACAPFSLPIILVAWLWGVGPALLGIVLGYLMLDAVIIPPFGVFTYKGWGDLEIYLPFIVSQLVVVLITSQRERARRKVSSFARELTEANQVLARSNDHLEQLNGRLAEINQLKDYFLSQASHELKTPITAIRAQTQLALRRLAKIQQRVPEPLSLYTHLEKIENQTRRLQNLIEDLLDISSLNLGKIPLRLAPCDLSALCSEVIEDQRALSDRRIELELPSEPLILQADAQRFTQVIINLVNNAVKYAPENSVVRVSARREADNIIFMVHNEDSVIPQEQQMHIFEPFYRSPEAEHLSIPGSGLGLAISKEIVERHDGQISVESTEGKGTTFFVRLPVKEAGS